MDFIVIIIIVCIQIEILFPGFMDFRATQQIV